MARPLPLPTPLKSSLFCFLPLTPTIVLILKAICGGKHGESIHLKQQQQWCLDKWPCSLGRLMLLQKTQVWFPAATGRLTIIHNSGSRYMTPSSDLGSMHVAHMCINRRGDCMTRKNRTKKGNTCVDRNRCLEHPFYTGNIILGLKDTNWSTLSPACVTDFIILHPWLQPTDQWEPAKFFETLTSFHLRNVKDPLLTLIRPNPFQIQHWQWTAPPLSPSPASQNCLFAAGSENIINYLAVLNYFFYPSRKKLAGHALPEKPPIRLQSGLSLDNFPRAVR